MMPFFFRRLTFIVFLAWHAAASAQDAVLLYSNSEHNYRLSYPASWHISVVPGKGGPTIYSYSPSSALGQGLISTEGGAEINISPLGTQGYEGKTLHDRAVEDARRFSHGGATIEDLVRFGNGDISEAVRAAYDYQRMAGEDLQRSVFFYFSLTGKPFAISLTYWKDDAKAASYEETLLSILKSIRRIPAK